LLDSFESEHGATFLHRIFLCREEHRSRLN
jgi:hypothetical protein